MPAPALPDRLTYDYAWLRVVPRVDTGDFITVGVILFCRTRRFLGVRLAFDPTRLAALAPLFDHAALADHLALLPAICDGEGPIGQMAQAEIFHWMVAPHSTVIQASPVHSGLCHDPVVALDHLAAMLPHA